ncbi:chromate transporter [Paenibacillus sp. FSL H7-0326]|uniref:chromate transporter n=1 Tax=Paenibacillus sp. FSL H7-0326 TaxID=1921144 RepID=UPI00096D261C|nr:chromate transporter [Paenibacillus sp. FSL H7-0326]OMC67195.1 chromate transporter [Paenibacillus sp. FSL H7-0326]
MTSGMKNSISRYLQLFWLFFKIGPSTFGGGYAMIPVLEREMVEKRGWISRQEMNDLMSLAGSAPGGVGVNASAFIGYRIGKVPGAVAATVGITLPTFLIVFILSSIYSVFQHEPKVQAAMKGIHGAIIGLIAVAAYNMAKNALFDRTTITIAAVSLIVLMVTSINPTFMILIGLVLGMIIISVKKKLGMSVQTEKKSASEHAATIEYYI